MQRAPSSCSPPHDGELRDPKGSQEQRLFCQVQPCRPIGSKPAGPKSNVSCGPPRREASARATLRVANAQPNSSPKSLGFGLSPTPPSGFAAGRQGRRPLRSQEHRPFTAQGCRIRPRRAPPRAAKASPLPRTAIPLGIALLALAPNSSPKLAPVLRPVSASLRLRYRSAAFSRALGNLVKTRKRILTISLCRRRRADALNN